MSRYDESLHEISRKISDEYMIENYGDFNTGKGFKTALDLCKKKNRVGHEDYLRRRYKELTNPNAPREPQDTSYRTLQVKYAGKPGTGELIKLDNQDYERVHQIKNDLKIYKKGEKYEVSYVTDKKILLYRYILGLEDLHQSSTYTSGFITSDYFDFRRSNLKISRSLKQELPRLTNG